MEPLAKEKHSGLYVLGSLYPYVTGGMEIFNYHFLDYQLRTSGDSIYYVGENRTDQNLGNFIRLKRRWPVRIFYPFQFFYTVFKLRKKVDYAYLSYAEESWIMIYARGLTLRLFNIPYFITIHWGKEPDWKFKYPYFYYFRHARSVIGVSEPICAAFKKEIPWQDFKFIPPLIPFQRAANNKSQIRQDLGYSANDKILLYVGSLKPMKNPDKIIEAFRIIGPDFLETGSIRLIFVGTGEMANELQERVEKYDLSAYIRFKGLISREIIPEYYKASDFFIISSDYEGTSLSLLEAMFNGLAIIGSDAPGINRMLQHEQNALLYNTTNIQQLAESLKRIFEDETLKDSLGKQVYLDYNKQYSYESMIKKYQEVFYGD